MKRILLSRAESDLRMAKLAMDTGDEYDLQVAAFHIQQAVEKLLKQVITDCGESYSKTHEIAALINKVPAKQTIVSGDTLDSLLRDEALLSKWERVTRYDDPYMASRKLVAELYNKAEDFLSEVTENLQKMDVDSSSDNSGPFAKPLKKLNLL